MKIRVPASPEVPDNLKEIYARLAGIMCEARGDIDELRYLYFSDEMVKFLDDLASAFFIRHQQILVDHIVLLVCQLTDSQRSCGHDNLTYTCLLDGLPHDDKHQALREDLTQRAEKIAEAAEPIREYRNKALAHYDLKRCLTPSTELGTGVTVQSIEAVLDKIAELLTAFDFFFSQVETRPEFMKEFGDAEDLINRIKLGKVTTGPFTLPKITTPVR